MVISQLSMALASAEKEWEYGEIGRKRSTHHYSVTATLTPCIVKYSYYRAVCVRLYPTSRIVTTSLERKGSYSEARSAVQVGGRPVNCQPTPRQLIYITLIHT